MAISARQPVDANGVATGQINRVLSILMFWLAIGLASKLALCIDAQS